MYVQDGDADDECDAQLRNTCRIIQPLLNSEGNRNPKCKQTRRRREQHIKQPVYMHAYNQDIVFNSFNHTMHT